jgi:hypothetical protein
MPTVGINLDYMCVELSLDFQRFLGSLCAPISHIHGIRGAAQIVVPGLALVCLSASICGNVFSSCFAMSVLVPTTSERAFKRLLVLEKLLSRYPILGQNELTHSFQGAIELQASGN